MRFMQVSEEDLKSIISSLKEEPSVPGDGISQVRELVSSMLEQMDDEYKAKAARKTELKFKDIELNKKYRVRDMHSISIEFRGKVLEIVEKKRSKVVGVSQSAIGKSPAGTRFSIHPELLEEM